MPPVRIKNVKMCLSPWQTPEQDNLKRRIWFMVFRTPGLCGKEGVVGNSQHSGYETERMLCCVNFCSYSLSFHLSPGEAAQERGTACAKPPPPEWWENRNLALFRTLSCERVPPTSKAGFCLLSKNKFIGNLGVYFTGLWASRPISWYSRLAST